MYIFLFKSKYNFIKKIIEMFYNLDKIFILGLIKNKEQIEKKFSSMFPYHTKKLEYFLVPGIGSNQNDGCYDSSLLSILKHNTVDNISRDIFKNHVAIYKKAKTENLNRIMILEDDAVFSDNIPYNQKNTINRWIKENTKYDILYLGYCNWPWIMSTFQNLFIVKPYSPLTLHAYIMNKKGIDKVLSIIENNSSLNKLHIDKLFQQEKTINKYAVYPMIAFQEKDPSLYTKACDKIGIYLNFKSFCRFNEIISLLLPIFMTIFICIFFYFFLYK